MIKKELLLGDEAIAWGALNAGLSGVYAYPGTPSTEITEFIQMHPLTRERGIHCNWSATKRPHWKRPSACRSSASGPWSA